MKSRLPITFFSISPPLSPPQSRGLLRLLEPYWILHSQISFAPISYLK